MKHCIIHVNTALSLLLIVNATRAQNTDKSQMVKSAVSALGDRTRENALFDAIDNGDAKQVSALIKAGVDPNAWGNHGRRPLMAAIEQGSLPIFNTLLQYKADVNARALFGRQPLHYAANSCRVEMAKILIRRGADARSGDDGGFLALHEAAGRGCVPIAKLLVEHGANVNAQGLTKSTPLMFAVSNNHPEMVTFLLRHKADVTLKNKYGETAWTDARDRHLDAILKLLPPEPLQNEQK